MKQNNIRNFSIIAHIDHGKSTLADRILEITGAITDRESKEQLLDSMDIERERGITIKLNAVQLKYNYKDEEYILHLIDTPGHVDFSYEVSRSLAACEGAILVVDAAQGIEAQTLANLYLAMENNLEIIPIINKIDLPNADVEKVTKDLCDTLGFREEDIILASGKTGAGVKEIIEAIIERVPAPSSEDNKLKALVFDSYFDPYKGVVANIRIFDGSLKVGDQIKMMATNAIHTVTSLGVHTPFIKEKNELVSGEVGFVAASVKKIDDVLVGDTVTLKSNPADKPLPGYKPMKPMVFCGLYPIQSNEYEDLKEALEKLKLNDSSLNYEPETSKALGFGFRTGFLGMLHMEIVEERLEREFNLSLIATAPSVIYKVIMTDDSVIEIDSPTKLPDRTKIKEIQEPYINASIFVPDEYIGAIMELCQNKRGEYQSLEYIDSKRVTIHYKIPLLEVIYDFFERLKSTTKGYASFDYELDTYRKSDLVKLDILLNSEPVDALSVIVHRDFAQKRGRGIVESLRTLIPRQQFEIPIQASIGSKVIARADIKAMRKNVLAKCYGGDISRKRKLLEKQKEGKKRMKMVGNVEIPEEAFLSVLSLDND